MSTSPLRFMTMSVPSFFRATFTPRNLTTPGLRFSTLDCSERRVAAPPMWKVRMVSWVPGSPMDWAAMTPTASPMFTLRPRARSRP